MFINIKYGTSESTLTDQYSPKKLSSRDYSSVKPANNNEYALIKYNALEITQNMQVESSDISVI